MKLVHPELENHIIFLENAINVLTIENQAFFTKVVTMLFNQCQGNEGAFVLSENNAELSLSKVCEVIIDPITIDINNKKNINKIYTLLKQSSVDTYNYLKTHAMQSSILQYIDELIFTMDIPLQYDEDFDITALFKALNIRFETDYTTLLEKILDYITAAAELHNTQCFIFVNLKQFLDAQSLAQLYKYADYIKVHLLLMEGTFVLPKHDCEKHYVIDNDLCEIY